MDDTSRQQSPGRAGSPLGHQVDGNSGEPTPTGHQLHGTVVDSWGFDIISGALSAGTRQSCEVVSGVNGVSRTVIREAARVLEAKGLLTTRRRVGMTVQPPQSWNSLDPSVIRWRLNGPGRLEFGTHLMTLLAAVGPSAAGLAARNASSADRQVLADAVIGISAAARSADQPSLVAQVAVFHRTLLMASNNPLFVGLARTVDQIECWTPSLLVNEGFGAAEIGRHGAVVAAVRSADGAAAEAAMLALTGRTTLGTCVNQGLTSRQTRLTIV